MGNLSESIAGRLFRISERLYAGRGFNSYTRQHSFFRTLDEFRDIPQLGVVLGPRAHSGRAKAVPAKGINNAELHVRKFRSGYIN